MSGAAKLLLGLGALGVVSAMLSPNTVSTPRPALATKSEASAQRQEGYLLPIPLEPNVQYFVLEKGGTTTRPTMVTKRIGSRGTSYSRKEFDCMASTFRYLGDGETLEQMRTSLASLASPRMEPLVQGSSTHYQWVHACQG